MLEHWKGPVADFLSMARSTEQPFTDCKVWIGRSRHDPDAKETGDAFEQLFTLLGATVTSQHVTGDVVHGAAACKQIDEADAIFMLASTPGVSAEALEFCRPAKGEHGDILEKMRVLMPSEFSQGYIFKRLTSRSAKVHLYPAVKPAPSDLATVSVSEMMNIRALQNERKRARQENFRPQLGIVTALPVEEAAVSQILDNPQIQSSRPPGRGLREYLHGEIQARNGGVHRVVAVQVGKGNNKAATIATQMLDDYPSITDLIMVGIAAGVPDLENAQRDVRLGDVVLSGEAGVIQYDMIKKKSDEVQHDHPPRPPSAAWVKRATRHLTPLRGAEPVCKYVDDVSKLSSAPRPTEDLLIDDANPEEGKVIERPKDPDRLDGRPKVHIGAIGGANIVLKSAADREELRRRFSIMAVEMEGSGLAEAAFQQGKDYFIIRGICDYANDGKNKLWQPYAAAAAAAFAKELIESMPLEEARSQGG